MEMGNSIISCVYKFKIIVLMAEYSLSMQRKKVMQEESHIYDMLMNLHGILLLVNLCKALGSLFKLTKLNR